MSVRGSKKAQWFRGEGFEFSGFLARILGAKSGERVERVDSLVGLIRVYAWILPSLLLLLVLASQARAQSAAAPANQIRMMKYRLMGGCELRVGIQAPLSGQPKADLLFIHGYGGRFDNHSRLFNQLSSVGIRVISFDLPSHGGSRCDRLNLMYPRQIAQAAASIERATRTDASRPLILGGWSLGGVVATRLVQTRLVQQREVTGLLLLAPAFAQPTFPGKEGFIRNDTLTHDRRIVRAGAISPESVFVTPVFGARMRAEGAVAMREQIPQELPVFVVVGGDKEDKYIKTAEIKEWAKARKSRGGVLAGMQCPGAFHELDNEAEPVGSTVRTAVTFFAEWISDGAQVRRSLPTPEGCRSI